MRKTKSIEYLACNSVLRRCKNRQWECATRSFHVGDGLFRWLCGNRASVSRPIGYVEPLVELDATMGISMEPSDSSRILCNCMMMMIVCFAVLYRSVFAASNSLDGLGLMVLGCFIPQLLRLLECLLASKRTLQSAKPWR